MTTVSAANREYSAGDPLPPKCVVIKVHVAELKQLFNSIDPSPFRNKDIDPKAEEFIVGWAKDIPRDALLGLEVDLDRPKVCPTKPLFCAMRFTSSSFSAVTHFGGAYASCFA